MMRRRDFLGGVTSTALITFPALAQRASSLEDEEWRARLSPEQYAALRLAQTEQPYSSPLTAEKRRGLYACAGCGRKVFSSSAKYDSRTGWPSFYRPLDRAVREKRDRSQGLNRTEVECIGCDSHLGHIFGDGPPPTRLRYCINGAGLSFIPA